MIPPKRILLDNSVRSLALSFAKPILVSQAHIGYENPLALIEISQRRNTKEKFKQDQLEALPSIAELVKIGKIEIYTSFELVFEATKNLKFPIFDIGDLLSNSLTGSVPVPISRLGRGNCNDPFTINDGNFLIEFVSWLLKPDYVSQLLENADRYRLSKFEISNLLNIDILQNICKPIDKKQYGDAYHLWTATVNDMDFFLTSDKKFMNVVTQNKKRKLSCTPIFPTELIASMGVEVLKELPFEYGKKYYLNGMNYRR